MSPRVERLHIGPYKLVRQLEPGRFGQRWLAFNETDQSAHVGHRLPMTHDKSEQRRFLEAAEALSGLNHPHLLSIEQFTLGHGSGAWIVTPYSGSHDGLVTLASLVKDKGGRLDATETERAMIQVLEAVSFAHASGFQHGPMTADEILVDRRGSLTIELYGLRRRLGAMNSRSASEVARDELRSIVEIGYTLLTGLSAEEPRIRAGRITAKLDHRWDEWFDDGLDPLGGFASAAEALAGLPCVRREVDLRVRVNPVRTVIGRMAKALRSS